jgi:hypothetical protein
MQQPARYPIHLCQPDEHKSCGACCGLYNWLDHSRAAVTLLLESNTSLFFSLGENPDLDLYRELRDEFTPQHKLCDTIYNCEFIGFLDRDRKRIGCMLHPALHRGADLRDCSFYGVELCDGHFCPSYTYLTVAEQAAAAAAVDDWYLYGLVITDIDFIKEFFSIVQNRLGEGLKRELFARPSIRRALHDYFQLKETWKFSSRAGRLGKYYFSRAEYHIARIDYEKNWDVKPSRFDKILVSLASEFKTPGDIAAAELVLDDKINALVAACKKKG